MTAEAISDSVIDRMRWSRATARSFVKSRPAIATERAVADRRTVVRTGEPARGLRCRRLTKDDHDIARPGYGMRLSLELACPRPSTPLPGDDALEGKRIAGQRNRQVHPMIDKQRIER